MNELKKLENNLKELKENFEQQIQIIHNQLDGIPTPKRVKPIMVIPFVNRNDLEQKLTRAYHDGYDLVDFSINWRDSNKEGDLIGLFIAEYTAGEKEY